jgi:hypothetical protein
MKEAAQREAAFADASPITVIEGTEKLVQGRVVRTKKKKVAAKVRRTRKGRPAEVAVADVPVATAKPRRTRRVNGSARAADA